MKAQPLLKFIYTATWPGQLSIKATLDLPNQDRGKWRIIGIPELKKKSNVILTGEEPASW